MTYQVSEATDPFIGFCQIFLIGHGEIAVVGVLVALVSTHQLQHQNAEEQAKREAEEKAKQETEQQSAATEGHDENSDGEKRES